MSEIVSDLDPFYLCRPNGKSSVAILPRKSSRIRKDIMHPARGIWFQFPQYIWNGSIRPQFCKDVDMIFDTVDDQRNTTKSPNNAADIFLHTLFFIWRNQRTTIFCRKNNVIYQIRVRSWHLLCRPLRGLCFVMFLFYGFTSVALCLSPATRAQKRNIDGCHTQPMRDYST